MSESNKQLCRRVFEEMWNARRPGLADELIAPTHQDHDPNSPEFGRGPEAFRQVYSLYTNAFPDLRFTVESVIAEGDLVAVRWTSSGTHRGKLGDVEPTGRSRVVTGVTISRVANGKLQESWVQWDALGLMKEIGAVRPAGKAAGQ